MKHRLRSVKLYKVVERMSTETGHVTAFILDEDAPPFILECTLRATEVRLNDPSFFTARMVRTFNDCTTDFIFTLTEKEYDQ